MEVLGLDEISFHFLYVMCFGGFACFIFLMGYVYEMISFVTVII